MVRPCESFTPVPVPTKGQQAEAQIALDFDATNKDRRGVRPSIRKSSAQEARRGIDNQKFVSGDS
jgi:hypothetical protein